MLPLIIATYLLNIQASGLVVSEKKSFLCFPIISLWQIMTPIGMANLEPRGMVGRIYIGAKHCFTQNIKALGLMVSEKIFMFSFRKSIGAICCHGKHSSDPILIKT